MCMDNRNKIINENLIETMANGIDSSYVDNVYSGVCDIVSKVFDTINSRRPIITNYRFELFNECRTYTENQNSSLDMLVVIGSPQLELSNLNLNKNYFARFWNGVKFVFTNKSPKHLSKRKQKRLEEKAKRKQASLSEKLKTIDESKYNMAKFHQDVMLELTNYFTDQTAFFVKDNGISIYSLNELGMNINLYFVFETKANQIYKLFNTQTLKFFEIDLGDSYQKFEQKCKETNDNFRLAIRIFNGLYSNFMNESLNQFVIQSVLYSCPDELFNVNNNYDLFIKLFNYIKINYHANYKSITNEIETLSQNNLTKHSIASFDKFINLVSKSI